MHIHLKNKKENLLSQLGENGLLSTVQKCPRQIVMKTSAPKCSPTPTAAMARGPHVRSSIRISGSSSENGWGSNAASCARWALPAAPSGSEKNRRPAARPRVAVRIHDVPAPRLRHCGERIAGPDASPSLAKQPGSLAVQLRRVRRVCAEPRGHLREDAVVQSHTYCPRRATSRLRTAGAAKAACRGLRA